MAAPSAKASEAAQQAHAFAEPLLSAIADRCPKVAHDFSLDEKCWVPTDGVGHIEVQGGRLHLFADQSADIFEASSSGLSAADFVLVFDVMTETQGFSGIRVWFRSTEWKVHAFDISVDDPPLEHPGV